MPLKKGQKGKPTLFNNQLQAQGYTIESFRDKMEETLMELNNPLLWPPTAKNYIALLKSGAKDISQCSGLTILKICYTLNCSPNDIMPNILKGDTAKWE